MCMSRLDVMRNIEWSADALAAGQSYQNRLSREEFTNTFFPERMVAEVAANREFNFQDEMRLVTMGPDEIKLGISGRIARIPDRFREIF